MKGFAIFAVFSITYAVLVLLFNGTFGAELPTDGSGDRKADVRDPSSLEFLQLRQIQGGGGGNQPSKNGTGNPLVDVFQIEDPHTKGMLDAAYGTYNGDDQCMRKSACLLGNYMKELPGRDLMFILMGGYIPPEYSLFYDIFRNSALYGQNCNVYVCIAENQGLNHSTEPSTTAQSTNFQSQ